MLDEFHAKEGDYFVLESVRAPRSEHMDWTGVVLTPLIDIYIDEYYYQYCEALIGVINKIFIFSSHIQPKTFHDYRQDFALKFFQKIFFLVYQKLFKNK